MKAHNLPICRKLSIYAGTTLKTPEKIRFTAPPPQHFTGCRQHQCAAQHGLRGAALGKVVKTPPNVNQN